MNAKRLVALQSSILDKVAQKISHKNCQSIEDEEAQSGTEINSRATEPNIHNMSRLILNGLTNLNVSE